MVDNGVADIKRGILVDIDLVNQSGISAGGNGRHNKCKRWGGGNRNNVGLLYAADPIQDRADIGQGINCDWNGPVRISTEIVGYRDTGQRGRACVGDGQHIGHIVAEDIIIVDRSFSKRKGIGDIPVCNVGQRGSAVIGKLCLVCKCRHGIHRSFNIHNETTVSLNTFYEMPLYYVRRQLSI
ncbi:hypothetical protein SDC9_77185 [bioreactor metagenome]|uniref:Uncharacterized protein n=1 Tax=bioreactor metagenome TaxID=1076179 RepID=A0A644YPW3_9ZZZZ